MAVELLDAFESQIESLTLIPSDGGRFEISVNEVLVYSKLKTYRHPEPDEIVDLVREEF